MTVSLDGKVLLRAINRLEAEKRRRSDEIGRLRQKIYELKPRVKEIDRLLVETVAEAALAAIGGNNDAQAAVAAAQRKNLDLQAERAELITEAGYPMDCIDELPACKICGDTGYVGRKPCSCLMKLYKEEQNKELSSLLKLGEENFRTFKFSYYDDIVDPESNISPRKNMEMVHKYCKIYAERFNGDGENLFLNGGPGLGKTFLSSCIAGEVSKKGYSVVYDTAVNIIGRFEEAKFSRNGYAEEAQADVNRYLNCDLLIIDDLGTEMSTAFSISVIYNIINTRLIAKKNTVINSNLRIDEIRSRYSPQIASRIEGEYEDLKFYGKDIRKKKKIAAQ
ncbi:MAG: ATP-binding protein [Papillibacter sp.]|nr:ATP-binding protein [Papillibacter sp.]